jgi:hypothetical protein
MRKAPAVAVLTPLTLTMLCGCVVIPQGTLPGSGGPTPNERMKEALANGRVKIGESKVEAVAAILMEYYGTARYLAPGLYESKPQMELAAAYYEETRATGVTLNRHFYFVPMPMVGAKFDNRRGAVLLKYDDRGVLQEWRCVSNPDLSQYEFRWHEPAPATSSPTRPAGATTPPS